MAWFHCWRPQKRQKRPLKRLPKRLFNFFYSYFILKHIYFLKSVNIWPRKDKFHIVYWDIEFVVYGVINTSKSAVLGKMYIYRKCSHLFNFAQNLKSKCVLEPGIMVECKCEIKLGGHRADLGAIPKGLFIFRKIVIFYRFLTLHNQW